MDDIPLIYDPATGNYHRISRSSEVVISYLDGTRTRDDLVAFFTGQDETHAAAFTDQLDTFLASLADSGLLVGSPLPKKAASRRVRTSMLMPRIVISESLPNLLEPLARGLRLVPAWIPVTVAALGAVCGYALGFHTLLAGPPPLKPLAGPAFVAATCVMLVFILVHETAHALVAQVLRAPVRGLGVALLFFFMPVAYVDRTDAYRVRDRGGRITLALAGIMSDGWLCGLTGVAALRSTGFVQQVAATVLGMQLLLLFVNLNPLMPSDGYAAVEAATGLANARGRAFALLKATLTRRPLPAYLANTSGRVRAAYLAYGLISALYVCMLAWSVLRAIPGTVHTPLSAVTR